MRCLTPVTYNKGFDAFGMPLVNTFPCGKCSICYDNRQRDWVFRLEVQISKARSCQHVTLTYNEDNLPFGSDKASLMRDDLTKFLKKLRKKTFVEHIRSHYPRSFNLVADLPLKMKYYAVGEYGGLTERPHYHILLFDYGREIFKQNNGKMIYLMHLNERWSKGNVTVTEVGKGTIKYLTTYFFAGVTDKSKLEDREHQFMVCSKGIGMDYVNDMFYYHDNHKVPYARLYGQHRKLPRYLKNKLYTKKEIEEVNTKIPAPVELSEYGALQVKTYYDQKLLKSKQKKQKL